MSSPLSNMSRNQKRLAFLAIGLASSYAVLKWVPRQLVPALMYLTRNYHDPFFGQEFHLKSLVVKLLQGQQQTQQREKESNVSGPASVLWQRQLGHGQKSATPAEAAKKIEWRIELFQYNNVKDQVAPQRGFLLLPRVLASGEKENQVKKLWVVYGGNAMLALDWLDIFQEMTSKFEGESLRGLLKSPLIPQKGGLYKAIGDHVQGEDPATLDLERVNGLIERGKVSTGFVLLDYPGYGLNQEGDQFPSQDTIYNSTVSALDHVRRRMEGEDAAVQFSAIGHSIGCAAVLDFQKRQVSALTNGTVSGGPPPIVFHDLILSAPFTSITDMGRQLFGKWLPKGVLDHLIPGDHAWRNDEALKIISESIENLQKKSGSDGGKNNTTLSLPGVGGQVMFPRVRFTHGLWDTICPHWMSKRLIKDAGSEAGCEHVSWKNTGHNDLLDRAHRLYSTWIFLESQGESKL